jgi:ATP-dependent DNA helicase RecQ
VIDATSTSSTHLAILREVFGYPSFRGQQGDVIGHVGTGGDALVLMPTGGGKSLCYQVPAIARHRAGQGVTIVVSPLIALMHDQVGALEELGVHAAFLNSSLDAGAARLVEQELSSGRLVLLYAAPERVLTPRFLALLDGLHERGELSLIAIDEAHCVSQWGHDFRAEYLGLSRLHERYPTVPRIALTATADAATRAEIVTRLALDDARRFVSSFDRPNIRYTIVERDNARAQLLRFLRAEHPGDAGIVYCLSRRKVEETAAWLEGEGITALPYHAGLDQHTRRRHQDRFLREDGIVMVATIAFGMGIDKPDVRFVAHLDLPKSIEGYCPETGRAGRDGDPADAWMAYGLVDVVTQRRMIDEGEADPAFKKLSVQRLDALLTLAEAPDCRRVHLLRYFGQESGPCGNCDNCIDPPATIDATEAARMALSCVYRIRQHTGIGFGAGHVIDILRGRSTEKTRRHGHETLSTWGIGVAIDDAAWRRVVRQLVARGFLRVHGAYDTVELTETSRDVLTGAVPITVRVPAKVTKASKPRGRAPAVALDDAGLARFAAVKSWRSGVAAERGLPAYTVFHDATLAEMARLEPGSLAELATISGVGEKKLAAYGAGILAVLAG